MCEHCTIAELKDDINLSVHFAKVFTPELALKEIDIFLKQEERRYAIKKLNKK